MTIRVLSPAVAAGIAAGEVIERPASVVKELLENSIDSGAAVVAVEIQQGGLQSIRVSDDGSGIPANEVDLAFQRHATSKLVSLDGLSQIDTFGFRGEALASIAAAAHVRMLTRSSEMSTAAVVEVERGQLAHCAPEAAGRGTTVVVDALFSTIPARLKFIKSVAAETARIRQVIDHMAMANPDVRLTLRTPERTLLQTTGNGDLRDVWTDVHGADIAAKAITIRPSTRAAHPSYGIVSAPEHSRSNRTGISLFVNGRWVINAALNAAIQEAYRGLLMEGRFPFAAVFLDVPGDLIDVNVHPNKREVRFRNEGDAFSSIERSVREALLAAHPTLEARGLFLATVPADMRLDHESMTKASIGTFGFTLDSDASSGTVLPEPIPEPSASMQAQSPGIPLGDTPAPALASFRILGQIAKTYIVAERGDGMQLIDQHAAHESVLYYRLLGQWENRAPDVQPMLEPLLVELNPEQMDTLHVAREMLELYGLSLEAFGDATFLLRSVPVMARSINGAQLVADVLDAAKGSGNSALDAHHIVAASIACHSAIRAGQTLSMIEMEALGNALDAETNPEHCPHGRPTTIRVTTGMLDREFGRT